jgi:glycosyltransferase involved in cell wall biosynthesis
MDKLCRILVVNQYFTPDIASSGQLLKELCEGLSDKGHEITVVCSQPSYESSGENAPTFEEIDSIRVHRVSMKGTRGRNNLLVRALGYVRFLIFGWFLAKRLVKENKYDIVIALSNPPFVGVIGALISRNASMPFLSIMYDIHPDIVLATGWMRLPSWVFRIWNNLTSWILSRACAVVVLGEGMRKTLIETKNVNGDLINVIPVWARPEFDGTEVPEQETRARFGISEDEFLILFAGNIGIMQPIDEVIEAAENLKNSSDVKFLFMGGGVGVEKLSELILSKNLANVLSVPYQPFAEFQNLLLCSDVCLVTLADGMEKLSVPSRAYTFLSAGKPVIAMMHPESDVAELIQSTDSGWVVSKVSDLADLINRLKKDENQVNQKGINAGDYYSKVLRKDLSIDRFSELIGKVTEPTKIANNF